MPDAIPDIPYFEAPHLIELQNYGYADLIKKNKIEHPDHYCTGKIEVWDFISEQKLDYFLGNVIKYVCRSPHKGEEVEDLKKAIAYLQKKIELLEAK